MLPIAFEKRMRNLLGTEFDAFINSFSKQNYQALRVNLLKGSKEEFLDRVAWNLEPVMWEDNGFYYEKSLEPGKHCYHEAGAYYIQEPSAMAPGAYLDAKPGDIVLDLCAAPGGKSTQIAEAMQGEGLLISNEIHPSRAKILSENIERMGVSNCLVTNETPQHLSQVWKECFNKIMVDAPCSGEGMFRKNEEAAGQWSEEHVLMCAKRQEEILDCAYEMLKPGGKLVYSTCTFAKEENEDTIEAFLKRYNDCYIEDVSPVGGIVKGQQGTLRLFPHKLHGEGHFVAVIKKAGDDESDNKVFHASQQKGLSEKEIKEYRAFEKEYLTIRKEGIFLRFKDELYLAPMICPDLKGIKVLRPGLHLGTMKKERFEPAHALSHALTKEQIKAEYVTELGAEDKIVKEYLHGQTFAADGSKGWHLIMVDSYGLGWGKLVSGIMKNHYPKGLRTMY